MKNFQIGNLSKIDVAYFQRKPHPGFSFSLEFIFNDIRSRLTEIINYNIEISPRYNSGFLSIIINIYTAWSRKSNGINHITGEVHFLNLLMHKKNVLLTVLDCGMIHKKKGVSRYIVTKIYLSWPLKKASITTVISECTKQELIKFTGNKYADIRVIPVAVNEIFKASPKKFNKENPTILTVGLGPNKNFYRLVEALSGINCRLSIVGKLTNEHISALNDFNIDFSNYYDLSTEQLFQQYCECDILAFVSTFEGFGMPIVEANCVERVVVTSNISSMPEVSANAACFVNPFSINSIRDGILKVIGDDVYRDQLINNGRINKLRFNPQTIAMQYYSIYSEMNSHLLN
jgi:glycosyltransferase involved in cell wall biosynthesis